MSTPTKRRYKNYPNSKMEALDKILDQPALNYKDPKYNALLSDAQAGILKNVKKNYLQYLFVEFNRNVSSATRNWISQFASSITTAKDQLDQNKSKTKSIITFSLTNAGYDYLKLSDSIRPEGEAFRSSLNQRLNFRKDEINKNFSDIGSIHAIILIGSDQLLDEKTEASLLNNLSEIGTVKFRQTSTLEKVALGYSNFKDGVSNPRFFPAAFASNDQSKAYTHNDLPPLNMVMSMDKGGNSDAPCGSLGAFARFEFNQTAIQDTVKLINNSTDGSNRDLSEAILIGRFKDGTPLTLSNKTKANHSNHFNFHEMLKAGDAELFQDDQSGNRCPFFSHVRKSNPRKKDSWKHRIVRRGAYYSENKQRQGLLFISYQNSLEEQLEVVVNEWMLNDLVETTEAYSSKAFDNYEKTELKELDQSVSKIEGVDILFAPGGSEYLLPKSWNQSGKDKVKIKIKKPLIDFEGGLYFFTPSISFLEKLEDFPVQEHQNKQGINLTKFNLARENNSFLYGSETMLVPQEEITEEDQEALKNSYLHQDNTTLGILLNLDQEVEAKAT